MLMKLKEEQKLTYMFITHDMGVMRNVSTKIAIMYLGKICEIAPTKTFTNASIYTDAAFGDSGCYTGRRSIETKESEE